MGRKLRNSNKVLVENPEEKRSLVKARRRGEDNNKKDFGEILGEGMEWIQPAQYRYL
jgi:hypothetical protein